MFVQATVDKGIQIEHPGESQDVPGAVDRPNVPVYCLDMPSDASTRRCRTTLKTHRFGELKGDPRAFRKLVGDRKLKRACPGVYATTDYI